MALDFYVKSLLTIIAICLILLAGAALTTKIRAAESMHCTGDLKANAWGGIESSVGSYHVDVTCD